MLMGVGVQPGVVEAFFCCSSLPVHTNTITHWMSGNSWRVYITRGLPGFFDSLGLSCVYAAMFFLKRFFFYVFAIFMNLCRVEVTVQLFLSADKVYQKLYANLKSLCQDTVTSFMVLSTEMTSRLSDANLVTTLTHSDICRCNPVLLWRTSLLCKSAQSYISGNVWGLTIILKICSNQSVSDKQTHLGFLTSKDLMKSTAWEEIPSNVSCE